MNSALLLAIGLAAGVLSGLFGIGGGIIIVPALMFVLKLKPVEAMATSLAALIPPVGLLGAYEYYRAGDIKIGAAALIALGLFAGAFFGARLSLSLPPELVRRMYGAFTIAIGVRILFFR